MDAWARKKEYRLIYRHGLETRQESTPPLDREIRASKKRRPRNGRGRRAI